MRDLEVFFDYICPYCLKGHQYLMEILPGFPDINIIWRPCESHPRPERYGMHSDLCIRGMFYAAGQNADILEYHNRMYAAAQKNRVNIEDPVELSQCVNGLLDPEDFIKAVTSGEYDNALYNANKYAFGESGVWAVPAYRMGGRKLDSIEDIGVTKQQLLEFITHTPRLY